MASCKKCGKSYHACGSCGLQDWEWDYCSMDCLYSSDEVKKAKEILSTLTQEQIDWLEDVDEYILGTAIELAEGKE